MTSSTLLAYAIRLASLAFGAFVIMASIPLAMLGAAVPSEYAPPPLLALPAAALLIASGFFYVGLVGRRMAKSRLHHVLAGMLLAVPLALGGSLLIASHGREWQLMGWFFLVPASLLFVCTVWPLHLTSSDGGPGTSTCSQCDVRLDRSI